ncbi:MAG: hypothetical protein EOS36_25585 [Mesorhizobium sp.]|uniref:hypothetical protein n=1 Tax=Mesorhizobium sp. TaxID=1871066 RepID=UPI000FE8EEDA|nr:hypothetical protein [Mesorhizobium sp.]RWD59356.1 MAG: hypothetical protein EOS36_25585 [Mesorhizobium sp.]RWE42529.1 MAG: hypothetical protein EOS79_16160 [Mesorhizobium sp.]
MASVSCWPGAACFALPVCWPGAQSFAEFGLVDLVVVESVFWSVGIVVVVDEDPLVELLDCAKAKPVDNAIMADAIRSRFMLVSCWENVPSVSQLENGETVPGALDTGPDPHRVTAAAVVETKRIDRCCRLDKQRASDAPFGAVINFGRTIRTYQLTPRGLVALAQSALNCMMDLDLAPAGV